MAAVDSSARADMRSTAIDRRFCIAPMMDCSDRHSRFFLRLFSRRILLYTEMVTAAAVVHGDQRRLLEFSEAEHPLAVQLGGSQPDLLYRAAQICRVIDLVGAERVALGPDVLENVMEALPPRMFVEGLESLDRLPRLTEALLDAEIPEDTVTGFLGGNWLRLWESVLR